jgi:HEAT repeat protein
LAVKEDIVRALSVSWAKPVAAPALVAEFHRMENESNTGIKWAIANALSVVADDSVFEDIVNLVRDTRHGPARIMLALALGNMKDPHAQDVLISLLDDDLVAGQAIVALGKLKSQKAYPLIERFLTHPKAWIRKEARKALVKIEKADKKHSPK